LKNIVFPINFYSKYKECSSSLSESQFFIKIDENLRNTLKSSFEILSYVCVEIGFGKGEFLIDYAKANPSYQIIGIEKSLNLIKKLSRRLEFYQIENVRLIEGKADFVFYFLVPEEFVDEVIINFPDPWPKKAHIERRLINHNFFKLIFPKLKSNSRIYISTDVEDYKNYMIEELNKTIRSGFKYDLKNVKLGFWNENFSTRYLRKWLRQNKKIYSLEIVRYTIS